MCIFFPIKLEDQTESRSGICISTDTCWQKKGSGRSYNSLSGKNDSTYFMSTQCYHLGVDL